MKRRIRLTETQLRKVIKESVKHILRERRYEDYDDEDDERYENYSHNVNPFLSVYYSFETKQCSLDEDCETLGGHIFEVCLSGTPVWDNDGIGHYEYWGSNYYDKGTDYVSEIENIYIDSVRLIGYIDEEYEDLVKVDDANAPHLTKEDENIIIDFAADVDVTEWLEH